MNNGLSLKKWIFNPSEYTAGFGALGIGVAVMAIAAVSGYYLNGHFDGVIDLHFGSHASMAFHFMEVFGIWALFSALLYISGKIVSRSSIRIVDVFGTQALARLPMLPLLAMGYLMLPGLSGFTKKVMAGDYNFGGSDIALIMATTCVALFFIAWTCIWMYKAYATSCNIKGPNAIISFIIVMIITEALSKVMLHLIKDTL